MTYISVTGKDTSSEELDSTDANSADTEITVEFKGMPEKTPKECLQMIAMLLDDRLNLLAEFSDDQSTKETCGIILYCFHKLAEALEIDPKEIELEFVKKVLRKMSTDSEDEA